MYKHITKHFPTHKTFVDVMSGSASITLKKELSKNEVINDINKEVVNVFKVIRDNHKELKEKLRYTLYSRQDYYDSRVKTDDKVEQARRTILRAWFGIGDSIDNNTGFRVSLSQRGSVTGPWINFTNNLDAYAERIRSVIIENMDYKKLIKKYDKEDTFFYIDPPYLLSTRNSRHSYKHDFTLNQHEELCNIVQKIKGKVLISGYKDAPYTKLTNFNEHSFKALTNNKTASEFLWCNYK